MRKFHCVCFCLAIGLLFACDKEQKRVKQLNGEWELVDYFELNADATRKLFETKTGSAIFSTTKKSKEGTLEMHISAVTANGDTTTFNYQGNFLADSNAYFLFINEKKVKLELVAQTKVDLQLRAKYLTGSPLSDMVFKKKN